jgi:hypothetical protein
MKVTGTQRQRSEAELLDHATDNLLRALKRDMLKTEGRVDCQLLRKKGHSKRLLTKLAEV